MSENVTNLERTVEAAQKMYEDWNKRKKEMNDYIESYVSPLIGDIIREEKLLLDMKFEVNIYYKHSISFKSENGLITFCDILHPNEATKYSRGILKEFSRMDSEGIEYFAKIKIGFGTRQTGIDIPWTITEEELDEFIEEYGIELVKLKTDEDFEGISFDKAKERIKEYEKLTEKFKKHIKTKDDGE